MKTGLPYSSVFCYSNIDFFSKEAWVIMKKYKLKRSIACAGVSLLIVSSTLSMTRVGVLADEIPAVEGLMRGGDTSVSIGSGGQSPYSLIPPADTGSAAAQPSGGSFDLVTPSGTGTVNPAPAPSVGVSTPAAAGNSTPSMSAGSGAAVTDPAAAGTAAGTASGTATETVQQTGTAGTASSEASGQTGDTVQKAGQSVSSEAGAAAGSSAAGTEAGAAEGTTPSGTPAAVGTAEAGTAGTVSGGQGLDTQAPSDNAGAGESTTDPAAQTQQGAGSEAGASKEFKDADELVKEKKAKEGKSEKVTVAPEQTPKDLIVREYPLNVSLVDENGSSIGSTSFSLGLWEFASLTQAPEYVEGYTFVGARINGIPATSVQKVMGEPYETGFGIYKDVYFQFRDAGGSLVEVRASANLSFVYRSDAPAQDDAAAADDQITGTESGTPAAADEAASQEGTGEKSTKKDDGKEKTGTSSSTGGPRSTTEAGAGAHVPDTVEKDTVTEETKDDTQGAASGAQTPADDSKEQIGQKDKTDSTSESGSEVKEGSEGDGTGKTQKDRKDDISSSEGGDGKQNPAQSDEGSSEQKEQDPAKKDDYAFSLHFLNTDSTEISEEGTPSLHAQLTDDNSTVNLEQMARDYTPEGHRFVGVEINGNRVTSISRSVKNGKTVYTYTSNRGTSTIYSDTDVRFIYEEIEEEKPADEVKESEKETGETGESGSTDPADEKKAGDETGELKDKEEGSAEAGTEDGETDKDSTKTDSDREAGEGEEKESEDGEAEKESTDKKASSAEGALHVVSVLGAAAAGEEKTDGTDEETVTRQTLKAPEDEEVETHLTVYKTVEVETEDTSAAGQTLLERTKTTAYGAYYYFTVMDSSGRYVGQNKSSLGTTPYYFPIRHGESVTFNNLPVGSYIVSENLTRASITSFDLEGNQREQVSLTKESPNASVTLLNHYKHTTRRAQLSFNVYIHKPDELYVDQVEALLEAPAMFQMRYPNPEPGAMDVGYIPLAMLVQDSENNIRYRYQVLDYCGGDELTTELLVGGTYTMSLRKEFQDKLKELGYQISEDPRDVYALSDSATVRDEEQSGRLEFTIVKIPDAVQTTPADAAAASQAAAAATGQAAAQTSAAASQTAASQAQASSGTAASQTTSSSTASASSSSSGTRTAQTTTRAAAPVQSSTPTASAEIRKVLADSPAGSHLEFERRSDGYLYEVVYSPEGEVLAARRVVNENRAYIGTGDESSMLIYAVVFGAAIIALGLWLFLRKRGDKDKTEK